MDEFVSKTYTLSLDNAVTVASGETVTVALDSDQISWAHVLVYLSADAALSGADLNQVEVKIIEPCSGDCNYEHQVFPNDNAVGNAHTIAIEDVELGGNNPGDDIIAGQWFVEIKNLGSARATLKSLTLNVNARLD